jgi:regulator of replication initiation timing
MSAALAALAAELDAKDRELQQLTKDVERICKENGDLLDELFAVKQENERLREQLGMAPTTRPEEQR